MPPSPTTAGTAR